MRAVSIDFVEAIIEERNGEACALTTNVEECLTGLIFAAGFLGEGGLEAILGDNWREELEEADVTFTDDAHATVAPILNEDEPTMLVRQDGKWLIVVEES